jgi:hypothetical protein
MTCSGPSTTFGNRMRSHRLSLNKQEYVIVAPFEMVPNLREIHMELFCFAIRRLHQILLEYHAPRLTSTPMVQQHLCILMVLIIVLSLSILLHR